MAVLSDELTEELAHAVERSSGTSAQQRVRSSKDLGETMVIAHATVAAEAGEHVIVLIDEGGGCIAAAKEATRLQRLRNAGRPVGSINLVHAVTVLECAAGSPHLPDRDAMWDLYSRLRKLDDGLPPLKNTNLMSLPCWQ